ncbi:MAG: helix-turn-helix transcriptional regulator [Oscillibacter sp.]|nr:helix-turn-helix transcriptional regulator [Oscillibacter sp.]
MTFGERLNQTRKKSGKTAQEMADMLGIGLRSYRAYESGDREPYFSNLVKIADFLNVSTDYLLCRDEFLAKNAD